MILESKRRIACVVFFAALAVCVILLIHKDNSAVFIVSAVDVGQGSAMLIQTQTGVEVLVDTGPSAKLFRSLSRLRPLFDRELDYLVISHADNDHMAMTPRLLSEYRVNNFISNHGHADNGLYQEVYQKLQDSRTNVSLAVAGDIMVLDGDTYLKFLWPEAGESYQGNRNDSSLVLRVVHGSHSVLFAGDISQEVEKKLVEKYGLELQSTVLFVAHHGSKTSTSQAFVKAVNPQYAVIQSGSENRYGHPHADVITTLSELGIPILRNDTLGTINFIFDQGQVLIQ